jgi:hypothetical protein
MNRLRDLFISPDLYPLMLDVERNVLTFVPMSRESYRNSVFLDLRTRPMGEGTYELPLDDLLLAATRYAPPLRRVHYILNSAYCCSTLMARYFELLPSCFVLKEPRLLAQLALMEDHSRPEWKAVFDLCLRLLSRTYAPDEMVVMKPVDCCSMIGNRLLQQNSQASITFLMIPLRNFILSILKSGERRDWARMRIRQVFKRAAVWPEIAGKDLEQLNVAESSACLWLVHRYLAGQLLNGPHHSRVLLVNGDDLAEAPRQPLAAILEMCRLPADEEALDRMVSHPSVARYSKDLSRPYDASTRSSEIVELERCWSDEADAGMEWAARHAWPGLDVFATTLAESKVSQPLASAAMG